MRDMVNHVRTEVLIEPQTLSGQKTSAQLDTNGAGRLMLLIVTGAIVSDGSFNITVQESDTTTAGDFTEVAPEQLLGGNGMLWGEDGGSTVLAANTAYRIGYTGWKRYLRVIVNKSTGTSIVLGLVAVLGDLADRPAA